MITDSCVLFGMESLSVDINRFMLRKGNNPNMCAINCADYIGITSNGIETYIIVYTLHLIETKGIHHNFHDVTCGKVP